MRTGIIGGGVLRIARRAAGPGIDGVSGPLPPLRSAGIIGGGVLRIARRAAGAGTDGVTGPLAAAGSAAPKLAPVLRASSSPPSSSSPSPTFASARKAAANWDFLDSLFLEAATWDSLETLLFDGEGWERNWQDGDWEKWKRDLDLGISIREEGRELEEGSESWDFYIFRRAPSSEEAEAAISNLHRVLPYNGYPPYTGTDETGVEDNGSQGTEDATDKEIDTVDAAFEERPSSESSVECETDWVEPAMQLYGSNSLQSKERDEIFGALQLFQTNEHVQRMVLAISSDKDVWHAVMNDEVVQGLERHLYRDESESRSIGNSTSVKHADIDAGIVRWILVNAKASIDKIRKLAHGIFRSQKEMDEKNDAFENAVRSSFMISTVVFMIISVTRMRKG